jgi:hypothetical protein
MIGQEGDRHMQVSLKLALPLREAYSGINFALNATIGKTGSGTQI